MGPFPGQGADLSSLDSQACGLGPCLGVPQDHYLSLRGHAASNQPTALPGLHRPTPKGLMALGGLRDTSPGRQRPVAPGCAPEAPSTRTEQNGHPPLRSHSPVPCCSGNGHPVDRVGCRWRGEHHSHCQGQCCCMRRGEVWVGARGTARRKTIGKLQDSKNRTPEATDRPGTKVWVPVRGEEATGAGSWLRPRARGA